MKWFRFVLQALFVLSILPLVAGWLPWYYGLLPPLALLIPIAVFERAAGKKERAAGQGTEPVSDVEHAYRETPPNHS